MILIPGTSHQITWSIQNLQDTTTYYVQAVIRDVRTNTILATINLTDMGNGRFSGYWNVPQDPTGFGREIEIERTVYEDAGYTTASGLYGRWLDRYLIFNLGARNSSTGGYGPGGAVDYREISKIIGSELQVIHKNMGDKANSDEEHKKEVHMALQDINKGLIGLSARISRIEDDSNDLGGNLGDLGSSVDSHKSVIGKSMEEMNKSVADILGRVESSISGAVDSINSKIDESMKKFGEDLNFDNKTSDLVKEIKGTLDSTAEEFKKTMTEESTKMAQVVSESLSKPLALSVSLAKPVSEKPNPRADHIKSLLQ